MALTDQTPPPGESPLRKLIPLTSVGVIIAAIYTGYTLYSRHQAGIEAQKAAEARQEQATKEQNDAIFQHGQLTITTFEASDGTVRPGQATQLCYGVVNAKSVKLDPPLEESKPSYRHCLEITPKKTTTYTLTALGEAGDSKTASLTVHVR
jgi:hypothetical protein